MFFYQMQEEALKQYEEKTGKEVEKQIKPVEVTQSDSTLAVKTRRKTIVERIEEPKPLPLKLSPVVTSPSVYEQLAELPPWVFGSIIEQTNVISLDYHRNKRRQRNRRRAAAFLLLAA